MPVRSPHCLLYLSSGRSLWLHGHIAEGVITWYTYRVLLLTCWGQVEQKILLLEHVNDFTKGIKLQMPTVK